MRFNRVLLLTVFAFFITFYAFSQDRPVQGGQLPQGSISGSVIEEKGGHVVEYANVVVFREKDSSMLNGTITDARGKFRIDKIPPGDYYVRINFIGFAQVFISGLNINQESPSRDLGTIQLKPSSARLSEVEITGTKDEIEYNLDKRVVNVDKNIASAGGTALDIMQTIPSVSVDVEGTVSLRGSSNVTILIDGRPSGLTSLDQIPASMIDRVEIVTNPSARYDPDGMSGIINIVTKKKKDPGYNGMITLNAGTGDKYNGSLNFNYGQKKYNLYLNADGRIFHMRGNSFTNRESTFNDAVSILDQQQNFRRRGAFGNVKIGADFFLNERNTLSVNGVYNDRNFFMDDATTYLTTNGSGASTSDYERITDGSYLGGGFEAGMDYKKTFSRKNRELTAALFYSNTIGDNTSDMQTNYYFPETLLLNSPFLQNSLTDLTTILYSAQTDYVHPFGEAGRLETGYKITDRTTDMDYNLSTLDQDSEQWVTDSSSSNRFLYKEQIHAAYLIYGHAFGNFMLQGGFRAEQALTSSEQKTSNQNFSNSYFSLFPTLHMKYQFSEKHALQLSYSRRVNRPSYRTLNPFINNTDPLNLSAGNPYLMPEYTHSVELTDLLDLKAGTLSSTLYYRQTDNMITRTMTLIDSNTTYSTYSNLESGSSYGLELVINHALAKWWKMGANLNIFGLNYSGTDLEDYFSNHNFSWTGRLSSSFSVLKSLDIQASFNYASPVLTTQGSDRPFTAGGGQGRQKENYFADLGLKKDFLKNKLSLSLRVSDVFKTIRFDLDSYGDNYTSQIRRTRESRVLYLGVTYKINGGVKQKRRKSQDDNGGDDMMF